METNMKVYVDLDGVLCDFNKKILEITGKLPHEQPQKDMWRAAATYPNFYGSLEWMPDGQKLWTYLISAYEMQTIKDLTILTGIPWGGWASGQKKNMGRQ